MTTVGQTSSFLRPIQDARRGHGAPAQVGAHSPSARCAIAAEGASEPAVQVTAPTPCSARRRGRREPRRHLARAAAAWPARAGARPRHRGGRRFPRAGRRASRASPARCARCGARARRPRRDRHGQRAGLRRAALCLLVGRARRAAASTRSCTPARSPTSSTTAAPRARARRRRARRDGGRRGARCRARRAAHRRRVGRVRGAARRGADARRSPTTRSPTISPGSSTPAARPGGPRARCSPIATCWRWRRAISSTSIRRRRAARMLHAAPMSHGSGLYMLPHCRAGEHASDPGERRLRRRPRSSTLMRRWPSVSMFAAPTMVKRLVDHPGAARRRRRQSARDRLRRRADVCRRPQGGDRALRLQIRAALRPGRIADDHHRHDRAR